MKSEPIKVQRSMSELELADACLADNPNPSLAERIWDTYLEGGVKAVDKLIDEEGLLPSVLQKEAPSLVQEATERGVDLQKFLEEWFLYMNEKWEGNMKMEYKHGSNSDTGNDSESVPVANGTN